MTENERKQMKRRKLLKQILNHQVQGEAFIITEGMTWKSIVLNHFNKVQRGELTIEQLVVLLEKRYNVKYAQKHSLVRYPIQEMIDYIAKVTKKPP
ncbi:MULTISPECIES: hypothetical protein [Bacillati]|uniref:hypothetical protein n=1 Tax=Bacillati TaxID=1783272 RepID=UPI0022B94E25|nr:hypothetical protein [Caldifermentibacillus hisashii]